MADGFSDQDLFAEFERTPEPADRILMSRYNANSKKELSASDHSRNEPDELESAGDVSFYLASYDSHGADEDAERVDGKTRSTETEKSSVPNRHTTQAPSDNTSATEIAKLKSELCKLRKSYERLQRQSRIISTSKFGKLEEGPVVQVIYMNNTLSSKCKAVIESALVHCINERNARSDDISLNKRPTQSSLCLDEDENETPVPEEKLRQIRTSTVIGCSQLFRHFIIDTFGWPLTDYNPVASEGWDWPHYKQVFYVSLGDAEGEVKENASLPKPKRFSCFNCGGEHNLKDCKEPYNHAKVTQNRQKFQSESQSLQKQNSRYHVNDPKFSKFKAGHISKELREAMGLADNQLPVYIYNMRQLGYPPGHLQALSDNSSGITMFGEDGREVTLDGEPVEEGEIDAAVPNKSYIDVTKIVDYPGFNVPARKGVKDECKVFRKPEFSSKQSKERMAKYLSEKNHGVKRRSNGHDLPHLKRKRKNDIVDMEICDQVDDEAQPRGGRKLQNTESSESQDSDENMTLEELQQQKAIIKQQLALAEGDEADVKVLDSYEDEAAIPPLPPTPLQPPLPGGTPPVTPVSDTSREVHLSKSSSMPVFKTPETTHLPRTPSTGGSLSVSLGTPVTDSGQAVPDPKKFSKGIQQDIPFENLPGTTGTFKRVKMVLDRLRSQDEDKS